MSANTKAYIHVFYLPEQDQSDFIDCEIIATTCPRGAGKLVKLRTGFWPDPSRKEIEEICEEWNARYNNEGYVYEPGSRVESPVSV